MTESAFELDPPRLQIQPHNFAYVTVSFTPQAMISYNTIFEATLENVANNVKNKTITFDIVGDGNLPRFSVMKPTNRNKKGQYLMFFKRSVIGNVDNQVLVLFNEGALPAKINFRLHDPEGVYKIRKKTDVRASMQKRLASAEESLQSVVLQPDQKMAFYVSFSPRNIQTYEGILQLSVSDNQFEDTIVQLNGEGYLEDVTLDNLHSLNSFNEIEDDLAADEDMISKLLVIKLNKRVICLIRSLI